MNKEIFYDESGKKIEFFIKAKFSIDDIDYVAMTLEDNEDTLIYILKITKDENGEDILIGIDDEELEEAKSVYEELLNENN